MNNQNGSITTLGVSVALFSGLLTVCGIGLLDANLFTIVKKDRVYNKELALNVLANAFGGGFLTLGVYLFVPSRVRMMWYF